MKKCFKVYSLNNCTSAGLLGIRLVAGLAFMMHGWGKIQQPMNWMGESNMPGILQALAAFFEFGGGLAWILGLLTPFFSAGIACTMVVAIYFHAWVKGDPFVGHPSSYELALVYLAVAFLLGAAGPGKFSADKYAFGEK